MKTLLVYYSKTGNTRKVAQQAQAALACDLDEILFDEKSHKISSKLQPAGYDRVILMCPVWAFRLAEPMALYLQQEKDNIKRYRLLVTCSWFGLRGCVAQCSKILGTKAEMATKIKEKFIKSDAFHVDAIVKGK